MAKRPVDLDCMICGQAPCTCGKAAPKKASPRDAMKAAIRPVISATVHHGRTVQITAEDAALNDAIRNLANAEMLHPDHVKAYEVVIRSQPSLTERKMLWKVRREAN